MRRCDEANVGVFATWKIAASTMKRETYALYLASRDPRVPFAAKALCVVVVAYVLSPIDLIPDFIPVLGYLDDLILAPLGIALAIRLIPGNVLADCRAEAARRFAEGGPKSLAGAAIVVGLWLLVAGATAKFLLRIVQSHD